MFWVKRAISQIQKPLNAKGQWLYFVRCTGLEPVTSTLSRWHSKPTELTPHGGVAKITKNRIQQAANFNLWGVPVAIN